MVVILPVEEHSSWPCAICATAVDRGTGTCTFTFYLPPPPRYLMRLKHFHAFLLFLLLSPPYCACFEDECLEQNVLLRRQNSAFMPQVIVGLVAVPSY